MLIRSHASSVLLREVPNNVDAMALRAEVLFLDAKPSEVLTQLATILKLDPGHGRAKVVQGRVKELVRLKESGDEAFQKNEYQAAIASWTDALLVNGGNTWLSRTILTFGT